MNRPSEPMTMTPPKEVAPTIPKEVIDHLIHANFWDPFSVLGSHEVESGGKAALAIRAFLPDAEQAWVVPSEKGGPGTNSPAPVHPDGLFRVTSCPTGPAPFPLPIGGREPRRALLGFQNPYRFGPVLSDYDLHLLGEGTPLQELKSSAPTSGRTKGSRESISPSGRRTRSA